MTGPSVPPSPEPPIDGGAGADAEAGAIAADSAGSALAEPTGVSTRRSRRRVWLWIGLLAVASGAVAAAFLVKLPYYLVQPGALRPAEQRIDIEGTESFETDGEILFTTVFISQATPALIVRAWLDDAVQIRTAEEMYPDGDRDASQRLNFARMDLSKIDATLVALDEVGLDASMTGKGALVVAVNDGSGADGALEPGDVIVAVEQQPVAVPSDIGVVLEQHAPGDTVTVTVSRDGATEDRQVVLGQLEASTGRPVLGIQVNVVDPSVASDVLVDVDSGDVSGPSAGLAWTLAIIDRLTPGSLTGGREIAVTGAIRSDGTVGQIGALPQKVATVKRAGVELFLYPAETEEAVQAEMRRIAGDDVELRPVATVSDAIAVLAPQGLDLPG